MKIGLVSPDSLLRPGGIKNHILALKKIFKRSGHQVKIIAPRLTSVEDYGSEVILLGRATIVPSNAATGALSLAFFDEDGPKKVLEKENFDILHFHNPMAPFLNWQLLSLSRSAKFATFHADIKTMRITRYFPFFWRILYKRLFPKMKGIIAVSKVARDSILPYVKRKITIIPNGVDVTVFKPNNKPIVRYKDGMTNVLYVGRLEERKGVKYLLLAWQLLAARNLRLILVGAGPEKEKIKELIKKLNLKNVIMEGYVPDKDLPSYYATADVFCSPATKGESFGMVLLEAMASGVPIVAAANRGYKEILKEVGKECLAKTEDVNDLVIKLERLVKDENLRKKLGEWGRREAEKYSWDKIGRQVLEFYQRHL
jgi:phosphatidylinositol alpha-mannosyltransferase